MFSDFFSLCFQAAAEIWWLIAIVILMPTFQQTWLFWKQKKFEEMEFTLLEILMPRETKRSPLAMEQVLTTIHQLVNAPGDFDEYYLQGEVTRWYSLELASFGGEVHFYIRGYFKQKGLLEAAFTSYYPDLEVMEVPDYTDRFPKSIAEMYQRGYDCWGAEMDLRKPAAYPIRDYTEFESMDENKQFDPMAAFVEALSKIKKEEMVAIQYLISPIKHPPWDTVFPNFVENLKSEFQKKHEKEGGAAVPETGLEKVAKAFTSRTAGESRIIEKVEENLARPAFETLIRFVYFSPKHLFYDSFPRRAIMGAFNQYGSADLNYFVRNEATATRVRLWNYPYILPKTRNEWHKARLLYNFPRREIPPHSFMARILTSFFLNWNFPTHWTLMSTRSLATLFHPPTTVVTTAPFIKRIESRKAGPPAGLAIFGEESELNKFK